VRGPNLDSSQVLRQLQIQSIETSHAHGSSITPLKLLQNNNYTIICNSSDVLASAHEFE
jgi:hypothetical protein